MLSKVDFSQNIYRLLYGELYNRVLNFALRSGDTEAAVKERFIGLILGNEQVHLLVDLDVLAYIHGHCLFTLSPPGDTRTLFVEQLECTSKNDTSFVKDCISYGEALPNVVLITMLTDEKKYKAFKKKYNFQVDKIPMYRTVKRDESWLE